MNKVEIIMESDSKDGVVKLLYNRQPMPKVFEMDLHFNSRTNEFMFKGKRFKTDKMGQFFVDETTKDTAMEDVNLLNLFNPHIMNREYLIEQQKAMDWALENVLMTSVLNANNLIKERNCEVN